jgi:hypothetical protein
MVAGFYTKYPIDFKPYRVPFFQFNHNYGYRGQGCGAGALSIITGHSPFHIHYNICKRNHFSDVKMVRYLRQEGYTVIPVTQCAVTRLGGMNHIKPDHVLLVSQLMMKNEGSWIVVNNGKLAHNFDIVPLSPLEFINRPILSAYIVFHPKWKVKPKREKYVD